ncbi:hypothetical protein FR483_n162L [Paramecium bursaria Chlorella virus FR483]|uniref:Uncharacterized protein n162L n=1 Tax=Paramecium bursaria Chlorella virus FR483 TaxID=399781 RepID=A7J6L6_PBCVF|nr:hypothetical protein FR483_n162L [Paramecium bursaria Chlorella virus FR483]ABT15447.1 hypothetical protein FR483_n162L [Paramecium bursaria Chlorella virus FR483]
MFLMKRQEGLTFWSGRTRSFPTRPIGSHSLRSSLEIYPELGSYSGFNIVLSPNLFLMYFPDHSSQAASPTIVGRADTMPNISIESSSGLDNLIFPPSSNVTVLHRLSSDIGFPSSHSNISA